MQGIRPGSLNDVARGLGPCLLLALVAGCTLWVYWPGQLGGFILDDRSSLLRLEALATNPQWFWDYVFDDRSGRLGRWVSMFTFALEYAFVDGSAGTLKRHSILLHALIGVFVFWFAYLLCQQQRYRHPAWLSLLVMALWLLAPQQTSTVLYPVQRMAMLAAFLVLLSLVFYLKGRAVLGTSRSAWAWWVLCAASLGLAPFAKENGLLGLPLIVVLEAAFLRGRLADGRVNPLLRFGSWVLVGLGLVAVLAYFLLTIDSLQRGHDARSFTLRERLLTQPRILWDYVFQFYWPDLSRLGLFHDDVPVAATLLDSPGTALALASWLLLLTGLLALAHWGLGWAWPLLGLLLFFLGAHSMESGFFALELYFEHRNYLPSLALALLPAVLIGELGRRWPPLWAPLLAWAAVPVLLLALKTVSQVQIWSSPTLLALHHWQGHPQSVRANNDMATRMAQLGAFDAALEFSKAGFHASQTQKAARLERDGDFRLRNIALACMAQVALPPEELAQLGRVHPQRPVGDTNTLEVVVGLHSAAQCPDFEWPLLADRLAAIYLAEPAPGRASVAVYKALAVLMNGLERIEEGMAYASLALQQAPDNAQLLLMSLHFATLLEEEKRVDELKSRLLELQRRGSLSAADEANLKIYL
jgi:protein O-mannosyl-transferase